MSNRTFVCVLTALTAKGATALSLNANSKVSGMTKKASQSLGILDYRRVIQENPFTMEWEFKLSKAAGLAYSKARSNSFRRWVEDFEDKMQAFDKAEKITRGVDYKVFWEDRTL